MIKDIFNGIQAYFKAFTLLNKLKLWGYFIIPIIFSFILSVAIFATSFLWARYIRMKVANFWGYSWGEEVMLNISFFVSGFLLFVLGLIVFKHLLMAIVSPFMSPVSEKVEKYLLGNIQKNNTGFKAQTSVLARGVRLNIRNLFIELLWILVLSIFTFIPIIGIIFVFLIFLVQAYYAGFGNMDYTLERYFPYKKSVEFVRNHRGIAIGNGIVFMLILLIPFVGILIVLPLSVVASTVTTLKALHPEKFSKNQSPTSV